MSRLKQQIEQIIDEGDGDRRSVIIFADDAITDEDSIDRAVEVLARRPFLSSARAVLPCPSVLAKGPSQTQSESLFLNSQDSRRHVGTIEELKKARLERLQPILESEVIKKYVRESESNKTANVSVLWAGCSISLNVTRDDLHKFLEFDHVATQIFKNREEPRRNLAMIPPVEELPIPLAASSWGIQRINALSVWGAFGVRGGGVKVGILDSGVDPTHPDLKSKIAGWAEFDKNGQQVPYSTPHDAGNHGTICAGTVVGGNYSGKWIGVAPEAKLIAGLVLDQDGAGHSQIIAGMQWAIEQEVDVLNMSIGRFIQGPETPPYFECAIYACIFAGILPVIPIGNEGEQTSDTPGSDLFAFTAGATGFDDGPAGFSGGRTQIITESDIISQSLLPFIYKKPDISAPGVAIRTSVPLATAEGEPWDTFSGTSLSTAHVSGAIALLLSATNIRKKVSGINRYWLIHDLMIGSVEELGEFGQDARFGFGRIDALRAIAYAHECGYRPSLTPTDLGE